MQYTSVIPVSDLGRSLTPLEVLAMRVVTPWFLAQKVLSAIRRTFDDCTVELFLSLV